MTNNEMMRADMLDILFENRNKSYGAYELRRAYDRRMAKALLIGISILALLVVLSQLPGKSNSVVISSDNGGVHLKVLEVPKNKEKQPEKQKEVVKPKAKVQQPKVKQVATIKSTTPVIKPDIDVKDPIKSNIDIADKQIGITNSTGIPDDGIVKTPTGPVVSGGGATATTTPIPVKPKPDFIIQEKDPEFPGGKDALMKFMARNLNTPDELEAGETKTVRVKFKVDKDGTVTNFEIVNSAGDEFDKEVLRVCKKMPNWKPAIQNGINVPVHFVIPVTFMGLDE